MKWAVAYTSLFLSERVSPGGNASPCLLPAEQPGNSKCRYFLLHLLLTLSLGISGSITQPISFDSPVWPPEAKAEGMVISLDNFSLENVALG